ncbi:two component, sigma54 specific, transcriptional regulator, Fis family protein [Nitritalea halalkaliphila LW7]|uniref:Two component, sigma54 specific, transcriptional regulator, Fis family protein n=1 Tax=Nitritalea halalkaliphila LW7 TaxID=1189621 RepID=I5C081_9BACT|nr:sigma-54 dependent transcriptional regulator [Nitritalea halalkaliphila]EIM75233.1 two component, sigma54 specific, transcriptional regulator, Fis family protein [Nitritalea halalkaliphila LW7]
MELVAMNEKVLLIDDELKLLTLISRILELEGYEVLRAKNLAQGKKILKADAPMVVLSDVKLPDGDGVAFCMNSKSEFPDSEFILLTAYGKIQDGVRAVKAGVFDYLVKGDDNEKLVPLMAKAMEKARLQHEVTRLKKSLMHRHSFAHILGESDVLVRTKALAQKIAGSEATILLTGATGTGKEVFAQAIHYEGKRAEKRFLAINCSAISGEILESELFGHKAGAFTGATKEKKGLFEEAHMGTLFLDEIGEMPLDLQAKLLRVLENGSFIKVGDTKETRVNVRIIAATNRDLAVEVTEGRFREDLLYRLAVIQLRLPSLAERKEDIPLLAEHFIRHFSAKSNVGVKRMHPEFLNRLKSMAFKGNIRELKNVIERAVILSEGDELTADLLPMMPRDAFSQDPSDFSLAAAEKAQIQRVLALTNGNKTQAAKLLEIGLTTLYKKLQDYALG